MDARPGVPGWDQLMPPPALNQHPLDIKHVRLMRFRSKCIDARGSAGSVFASNGQVDAAPGAR